MAHPKHDPLPYGHTGDPESLKERLRPVLEESWRDIQEGRLLDADEVLRDSRKWLERRMREAGKD